MAFSYLVVVNAMWIRYLMIYLAQKLSFRNLTVETNFIMLTVFYFYLLNYAAVYLMAPIDSMDTDSYFLRQFFGGMYTDLNAFWFNDIGVLIVSTMVFNSFYPAIEFFMYWGIRYLYRMIDQRSLIANDPKRTHAKTLQAFEQIYQGPTFSIHWKYAYLLNVTYMTFLFGPQLPILFPVALISVACLFITERMMVAYSYIRPPMYDSTINATTIRLMMAAPLVYLFSATWMYTNQQVFQNQTLVR